MLIGAHVSPAGGPPTPSRAASSAAATRSRSSTRTRGVEADRLHRRAGRRLPRGDGGQPRRRAAHPRRLPAQRRDDRQGHARQDARVAHRLAAGGRRARRPRRRAAPGQRPGRQGRAGDQARGQGHRARRWRESESCPLHLENTAGTGGTLGRSFEELAELIDAAGGVARASACAWTPATCSPRATTSAPRRASRRCSTTATRSSARIGSARCTSTTPRRRWAPTATATPTSARASSAAAAARSSSPSRASTDCRACWRRPGRTGTGPTRRDHAHARDLRQRGQRRRGRR